MPLPMTAGIGTISVPSDAAKRVRYCAIYAFTLAKAEPVWAASTARARTVPPRMAATYPFASRTCHD